MTVVSALSALIGLGGLIVSGGKWLRVIQREHYLPTSVLKMSSVWARSRPANTFLSLVPLLATIGWFLGLEGEGAVIVAGVSLVVFPLGLPLRGRTAPLVWTSRLRRLVLLIVLLLVAVSWLIWSTGVGGGNLIPSPLLLALHIRVMEAGLAVAAPIERRLSRHFVDDAIARLGRIRPTVVGITGSYGKTSTKGYVRDLVEGSKRVVVSPASFNNRMGLARAVNDNLTPDAEVFVAEMGTYGAGEIADMCSWIPPEIAVITSIGPVHLERFKTESKIVVAKAEILERASTVVLNVDHASLGALAAQAESAGKNVWRCGLSEAAVDVRVIEAQAGVEVWLRGERLGEASVADVFAGNLACAIAVALTIGVLQKDLLACIPDLTSPSHRQTVTTSEAGVVIIDDTFNANPAGAARALEILTRLGGPQARRAVITPGMVELGPRQADANRDFSAAAAAAGDFVVIVGRTNRRSLTEGASDGGASVIVVRTRQEAVEWVRTHLGSGDVALYENDLPDHYP